VTVKVGTTTIPLTLLTLKKSVSNPTALVMATTLTTELAVSKLQVNPVEQAEEAVKIISAGLYEIDNLCVDFIVIPVTKII